jgi:hypothetical protein
VDTLTLDVLTAPAPRGFANPYREAAYLETVGLLAQTARKIRELMEQRGRTLNTLKAACNDYPSKEKADGDAIIRDYNEKFGAVQAAIDTGRLYLEGARRAALLAPQWPLEELKDYKLGEPLNLRLRLPNVWSGLGIMSGIITLRADVEEWNEARENGTFEDQWGAGAQIVGDSAAMANPTMGMVMHATGFAKSSINAYYDVNSQDYDRNVGTIMCMNAAPALDKMNHDLKQLTQLAGQLTQAISSLELDDRLEWREIDRRASLRR